MSESKSLKDNSFFQSGTLDTSSRQFSVARFMANLVALLIPIFGAKLIEMQNMLHVFNVFVLSLVFIGILTF
ncbi:hypothetical protein [Flavobacterium sp. UMI-01]|uniref:hypothetical protein n=1 Tax=Flavobacterium sp. UMI-01 TaxID=1441053 RepID=UPI001C7D169F|nr:hypothetical protein [Flavobacterium sp. UMI-01]GIZ10440.1 hypothetical protein FUMI01_31640 [Flavobacterium sp. UMI-01]